MTLLGLDLPEAARADIRAAIAGAPLPILTDAGEMTDLIFHAINEALTAIDRTAARAPNPEAQILVLSIAISMGATVLRETNKTMIETMVEHLLARRAARAAS